MKSANIFSLNLCTWSEVRDNVAALDPILAALIDELNLSQQHGFYAVDYPYGAQIVKNGLLQLPVENKLTAFSALPAALQCELDYNRGACPVAFVLKNTIESFLKLPDRIVPFSLAKPGSLLGLTKIVDPHNDFYPEPKMQFLRMTAGARSIFLLPKVSEYGAHQKLRKQFNVAMDAPNNLMDHWHLFRKINRQLVIEDRWVTSVLFFNKAWFEHKDDKAWTPFYYYLQCKEIENSRYWRNEHLLRLLYAEIHQKRQIKPAHHIADTARYLMQVALGALPGFVPAVDNSFAPVDKIQAIYDDIYDLNYAPTVMHPDYFSVNNTLPVYVSLQHNGALELNFKGSDKKTILTDLYDVSLLMNKYQDALKRREFDLSIAAVNRLAETKFNYFHSTVGSYANIFSTDQLPQSDPRFMQGFVDKPFAAKSHFLNGCVQIINIL